MSISKTPSYNLKVVLQETGLKADTLRAWERRYGLPDPGRTAGGHRLYSAFDIELIRWLQARQDEGLSISRAVDLWRTMEAEGRNPLLVLSTDVDAAAPVNAHMGENIAAARLEWVNAVAAYDEESAERVLSSAFAVHPPEVVVTEVLQKGMAEVGERWYRGELSVQQEHFASGLAARRLFALLAAAPAPSRPATILLACAPGEQHTLSLLLLALLLRYRGWRVIYLGADVPQAEIVETVQQVTPELVVLLAMQLNVAVALKEIAALLAERGVPVAFGGRAFVGQAELQRGIPGQYLGDELLQAVAKAEDVLVNGAKHAPVAERDSSHEQLLAALREHWPAISADVRAEMPEGISTVLQLADHFFSASLFAALQLGDLDLLAPELAWVNGLLTYSDFPSTLLRTYLDAHHKAITKQLGSDGRLLTDWLAEYRETASKETEA